MFSLLSVSSCELMPSSLLRSGIRSDRIIWAHSMKGTRQGIIKSNRRWVTYLLILLFHLKFIFKIIKGWMSDRIRRVRELPSCSYVYRGITSAEELRPTVYHREFSECFIRSTSSPEITRQLARFSLFLLLLLWVLDCLLRRTLDCQIGRIYV